MFDLSELDALVSQPKKEKVVWPGGTGPELYSRLWPNDVYTAFVATEKAVGDSKLISETYWWCIVVSTVDAEDNLVFLPLVKPAEQHQAGFNLLVPSVEECEAVKARFGHPQAKAYIESLWESAMATNGYIVPKEASKAKN